MSQNSGSSLATPERSHAAKIKRLALIALGWLFVALGIAGLFLPFLQGILFLLIGLLILSTEYRWARKLLARLRNRFPKVDTWLTKARQAGHRILGRRPGRNKRTKNR
jgi:hypothetical protein